MIPVSGVNTNTVQPLTLLTTDEKVKVRQPEEEARGRRLKPVMDEYIPEEPQEPSGRYWMGKDEDGQPKICFDAPERTADGPKQPEAPPRPRNLIRQVRARRAQREKRTRTRSGMVIATR